MKTLFISYSSTNDTRTSALINILKKISHTVSITQSDSEMLINDLKEQKVIHIGNGIKAMIFSIFECIHIARSIKNIDILFIDNRKAILPGFLIKWLVKPKMIVYDSREFYLFKETNHLSGKIGCVFEAIFLKLSDLTICTNKYRAEAMKYYHKLKEAPFVYENIFELKYSESFNDVIANQIYKEIINENRFRIISSAGCDLRRTTGKLVAAMVDFKDKADLLLVGGGIEKDCQKIRELILELKLTNVYLIDKVDKSTLKWLINNCDVGAVIYGQYDLNNKYCASGKLFEFIFEEKPVIASTNPPLKEMCSAYGIGVVSNDYAESINELINNYDSYKERVLEYIKAFDPNRNDTELEKYIKNKVLTHVD